MKVGDPHPRSSARVIRRNPSAENEIAESTAVNRRSMCCLLSRVPRVGVELLLVLRDETHAWCVEHGVEMWSVRAGSCEVPYHAQRGRARAYTVLY